MPPRAHHHDHGHGHEHTHDHEHDGAHPAAAEHGDSEGGWLRPAVFGVSDGLVSNGALVLGVAAGQAEGSFVLLAGISGLLAGAFSMAAGEWVSVQAQREAYELELRREGEHIARYPKAEAAHMHHILEQAGLPHDLVERLVTELEQRPEANLGFHARIELGIDPDKLDSPWVAAISSFLAFGVGAVVPLVPWFFTAGATAIGGAVGATAVALFGVGALLSRYTGRNMAWSGLRQLLIGAAAALVTTVIGWLIGA